MVVFKSVPAMFGSANSTLPGFIVMPVKYTSCGLAVAHAGVVGSASCAAESERLVIASSVSSGAAPVNSSAVLRTSGSLWLTMYGSSCVRSRLRVAAAVACALAGVLQSGAAGTGCGGVAVGAWVGPSRCSMRVTAALPISRCRARMLPGAERAADAGTTPGAVRCSARSGCSVSWVPSLTTHPRLGALA